VLESMKVGNKKEDGIEENSVYLILLWVFVDLDQSTQYEMNNGNHPKPGAFVPSVSV
jgi:hypothetical protein